MLQTSLAIRSNARLRGNDPAVVCGGRRRSWSEFADRIARFAGALRALGLEAGDSVAVLADNSELYLEAFFAIPWAGGVILPVNIRLSPGEVAYIVDHCRPRLALVDEANGSLLDGAMGLMAARPRRLDLPELDRLADRSDPVPDAGRGGDDPASIFYTGGTTGRAKGVIMTHANHVVNGLALWAGLGVDTARARYLHVAPMFHVADALFIHSLTLVGGCHVILPRFDAVETMRAIEAHRITDTILVPTMIQALLDAPERAGFDLSSLERMYYGAMPMPEATARRLIAALPNCGPVQLYGQTEAGPVITMLKPADHDVSGATRRIRSAGQPLPGVEIAIRGADGALLPPGEIGEVVTRSGGVMPGYWEDPEQTAAALRDGWLHTGDGGFLDTDGFLYIADRIKDMIVSGGENVYSIEVERAVTLHPDVAQCAVIGLPDARWGERVHAIVVPRDGAEIDETALVAHCRQHIAGYKCPRSIEWRYTPLPLSGAGKVLKRELKQEALGRLEMAMGE
jgi:long-chain acyl-CoA synthetase